MNAAPFTINSENLPAHIVLVEDNHAPKALRDMFEKARAPQSSVNTAIWVNAPQLFSSQDHPAFIKWCALEQLNITRQKIKGTALKKSLRRIFTKAAHKINKPAGNQTFDNIAARHGLNTLEKHISNRLQSLQQAFPGHDVMLTLRAERYAAAANPHIDHGNNNETRFIETLHGDTTCLVDNKEVDFGHSFNTVSTRTKAPPLWSVPSGSLTLITSYRNNEKPSMHTAPPQTSAHKKDMRMIVIYDLIQKKSSHSFSFLR